MVLQSIVIISLFLRSIFFFRGFLALAALVHMVIEVIKEASPPFRSDPTRPSAAVKV